MKIHALFLGLLAAGLSLNAQTTQPYFASYPTLTPDGSTVIFSYEGDLWKVSTGNPAASRLTAMQGEETSPRVSPDGKWLAFASNQFGNNDIYVMPLAGGNVKQLTFHDANDVPDSWSWDSKTIYLTSGRYNGYAGYQVPAEGGTPRRLFGNYFNTVHHVFPHPSSGELFFNDTWESNQFAQRKRYKGEYNPDIQSYNIKTGVFKKYTDYIGKDFWATLDKKGNIYFVSDEFNEEYNLYTFVNDKKTRLTNFETSIRRPYVSADGSKVVFEKDYQLYIYDVAAKKTDKLDVDIFRNAVLGKEQDFDVRGQVENFDISPDGKKMAFVARGEIFVSDIDGKFVQKLNKSPERALEVKWLSDNRTLLFNQTDGGYQNLFTIAANGSGGLKQLTKDARNNRDIGLNKSRTMAVYLSGRDEVRTLDLKSFQSKAIVKDELWGFQNSAPSFSPDEQYVLYTAIRNFEQDIFVFNLKTGQAINLTNTGVTEASPYWSPDGKHIYMSSSRTKPSYPYGLQDAHIYRMPLDKYEEPFKLDKFNELFKADEKKSDDKKDEKPVTATRAEPAKNPAEKKTETAPVTINADGVMQRLEVVGPVFGAQFGPSVFQKGEKTTVYYASTHSEGRPAIYRTTLETFELPKTEKVSDGFSFDIRENNGKFYMLLDGAINKYNPDLNKLDKMDITYKFRRNLAGEFNQMFYETWANLEENFYDDQMHGVNWPKIRDRYQAFIPYVNNRADLRILLNDMLGELNSSHMGFNSSGSEETARLNYRTLETGIIFDNDDPYRVSYIAKTSNADKTGTDIQKGDVLVKVNGEPVDKHTDRNAYFTKPSLDREIVLTFDRGGKQQDVKLHPESSGQLKTNLYDEWIRTNQERVDSRSDKKIAYVHMKNMSGGELETFLVEMVSEADKRDALILDIRYNTGGNVHDAVLNFLAQKPYLQWKYRGGKLTPQANFGPAAKPIVLLVNEQSLSDAEMTATGFKALKLGKIIGTETYRWIIFTSAKGLVDGSSYRLPSWGCFTLDGKDIEKEGVKPDIYVKNTFMDRKDGKDPQLDRAIDEIMKDLKH
ncbi:S41 family peptidase [Hufsiella ginkgonis]|uniref:Tricorn protease homolog n=1 Tax=Hufsiella ginkgonis TaxID=2695274 RepID=A0A7K1Y3Q1_9SPHI|nr:S41 family peptidase [Hufsiella ginkgonis]MXV17497.1 PDZ domain-containing protein [Hufsiella ginkgonis]